MKIVPFDVQRVTEENIYEFTHIWGIIFKRSEFVNSSILKEYFLCAEYIKHFIMIHNFPLKATYYMKKTVKRETNHNNI